MLLLGPGIFRAFEIARKAKQVLHCGLVEIEQFQEAASLEIVGHVLFPCRVVLREGRCLALNNRRDRARQGRSCNARHHDRGRVQHPEP